MSDTPIKPLDLSKTSSGRIDLKPAVTPVAPASPSATQGIRLGLGAQKSTTSRIDLSAIPGAQAAIRPVAAAPGGETDDIYKRRTFLLDTSKIPLSATAAPAAAAPAAGGAQPRTIRVARPTIRVGSSASGATFSPGRSEPEAAAAAEPAAKPTIRLKRPSGASVSVTPSGSSSSSSSISPSDFVIQKTDDEPGAIWAVCALLGFLAAAALVAYQVMTLKGAAY